MNNVSLTGRLTKDPEIRQSNGGTSMVKFSLAVNRRFKQQGQPDADFINCIAFGKTAETIKKYCQKGNMIGVNGHIQTGKYKRNDGSTAYTTDIVVEAMDFLGSKHDKNEAAPQQNYIQGNGYSQGNGYTSEEFSGDLPF